MSASSIIYADPLYFGSFREALDSVARERVYIEFVEAPALEGVASFQNALIASHAPTYFALDHNRVVGWCDIVPKENPRLKHRGVLGMGLRADYRGKGLGSQLMAAALRHASKIGLEKIELTVYATNTAAIALYKKHGFEQEGYFKNYRKLDGMYFDCLAMGKFL